MNKNKQTCKAIDCTALHKPYFFKGLCRECYERQEFLKTIGFNDNRQFMKDTGSRRKTLRTLEVDNKSMKFRNWGNARVLRIENQ